MKRQFPLFIIDTSRAHGRARETDYISCTSSDLPWTGEVTLLDESELAIDQDWAQRNPLTMYTDPRGGIRAKLKVVQYPLTASMGDLRNLMRRALKEWQLRRATVTVGEDITSEAVIRFADALLEQTRENLRANPADSQAKMVGRILTKIRNDYERNDYESND